MVGDNKAISALGAYFILLLLLSLFISFFLRDKKIIYTFCISLFVCYVISATVLNFYANDFLIKIGLMRELSLVAILVLPSLLLTLIL
jgi:hypothetical protein